MRILTLIHGDFPTSRPDIVALFGRYLPRWDIHTDVVARAAASTNLLDGEWHGGRALLSHRTGNRIKDQLLGFLHDVRMLWRARPATYDAIQVRDKVFAAVIAAWMAQARGLPMFYWMSFPMSEGYIERARHGGRSLGLVRWPFLLVKGYLGRWLLYRCVLPRCTHVFAQSDDMRARLETQGIPRDRITAVPMGVDLERTFPTPAEALRHESLTGRRVVAYLGSFESFRRLDFLLAVIRELVSTVPDVALVMIGDSEEPRDREALEATAASLGIADRVLWTGRVSRTEAWRWLVNAKVAVSFIPRGPLYDGASPTKLLEYLALGVPAVVNDQPDQRRVIEESGAGICCPMDQAVAANALRAILADDDLAERMRGAGPGYIAAERGYGRIAERVAEVYRRCVPTRAG